MQQQHRGDQQLSPPLVKNQQYSAAGKPQPTANLRTGQLSPVNSPHTHYHHQHPGSYQHYPPGYQYYLNGPVHHTSGIQGNHPGHPHHPAAHQHRHASHQYPGGQYQTGYQSNPGYQQHWNKGHGNNPHNTGQGQHQHSAHQHPSQQQQQEARDNQQHGHASQSLVHQKIPTTKSFNTAENATVNIVDESPSIVDDKLKGVKEVQDNDEDVGGTEEKMTNINQKTTDLRASENVGVTVESETETLRLAWSEQIMQKIEAIKLIVKYQVIKAHYMFQSNLLI